MSKMRRGRRTKARIKHTEAIRIGEDAALKAVTPEGAGGSSPSASAYKSGSNKFAVDLLRWCTFKELALTFDDIMLLPQFSSVQSRSDVKVNTWITKRRQLEIPLVAANMDSICEADMAIAMGKLGGLGVIHRYMSLENQLNNVDRVVAALPAESPVAAAIGVKNGILEAAKALCEHGVGIVVIDVAHGHHSLMYEAILAIKKLELVSARDGLPLEIIAGNIVTPEAAEMLCRLEVDGIKVGVGPGSICSTRLVTGHGMPQLTAIGSASIMAQKYNVPITADGGLRTSGDMVKALAMGANTLMCGSLFAGTDETPSFADGFVMVKRYRGMASAEAQTDFYGKEPDTPEGVSLGNVPSRGPVAKQVANLVGGIKSGLSYSGVWNLDELRQTASWVRVTAAGLQESKTL